MSALVMWKKLQNVLCIIVENFTYSNETIHIFCYYLYLISKYMALKVMKLCPTHARLTRLNITPEIGLARLAALEMAFVFCINLNHQACKDDKV